MRRGWLLVFLLIVINCGLVGWLMAGRREPAALAAAVSEATSETAAPGERTPEAGTGPEKAAKVVARRTPFERVYANDGKKFAANLRAIGCPEHTIKDILTAEIRSKYPEQEEKLRPLPADHVPAGWSPATSESKLLNRRREASELAKLESAELSVALGYEATVPMPLYAMRNSEVKFENALQNSSPEQQAAARAANNQYWAGVQALLDRTKGFWQPEDEAELNEFKQTRRKALAFIDP